MTDSQINKLTFPDEYVEENLEMNGHQRPTDDG